MTNDEMAPALFDIPPAACEGPAPASWAVYSAADIRQATRSRPAGSEELVSWMEDQLASSLRPWNGTRYASLDVSFFLDAEGRAYAAATGQPANGFPDQWEFMVENATGTNRHFGPQYPESGHQLFAMPFVLRARLEERAFDWQADQGTYPRESHFSTKWDDRAVGCLRIEFLCHQGLDRYCEQTNAQQLWVDHAGEIQGIAELSMS